MSAEARTDGVPLEPIKDWGVVSFETDYGKPRSTGSRYLSAWREYRVTDPPVAARQSRQRWRWLDYLGALAISGICTAIAFPFYPRFDDNNIVMLYLLGTTLGALRLGRGPCVLLAVVNILAFDYFFVPPVFSFDVADTQYLFIFGVMLVVALVIAHLMLNIRRHRDSADAREKRTAILYAMSRELSVACDAQTMAEVAMRHISFVFHSNTAVLIADENGHLAQVSSAAESAEARESVGQARGSAGDAQVLLRDSDLDCARQVLVRGERCIRDAIYLPLLGPERVSGVIVVRPRWPTSTRPTGTPAAGSLPAEQLSLLDAFAAQLALSLQRARIAEAAEAARNSAERALLRSTLLASISHDLRTPLSAIAGAGSLIAQQDYTLSADRRTTLGNLIERKASDMSQLLSNVLELAKLEAADDVLRTDWHAIEDLVSLALRANESRLSQWRTAVKLSAGLPLILVDATLIVQILNNLLENAAKYTPTGSTITISAVAQDPGVLLFVADDGPGLPAGDPDRLFEKFQRGRTESNVVGVGLGLAICRAAARLHGGDIRAMNNPSGGARFEITLPVQTHRD
jgi:two-component system sensor histidine kinase KdpD